MDDFLTAVSGAKRLGLIKEGEPVVFLPANAMEKRIYLDAVKLVVGQITSENAKIIKDYLQEFYPMQTPVILYGDDIIAQTVLGELTGGIKGCYAVLEGNLAFDKPRHTFGDLLRILSRLTAEDGCPWDKVQTHQSIRKNMIEEANEAAEAIDKGDIPNLIEELGDVMLQTVLHSDIALRGGEFTIGDVIGTLCEKLYRRHTHIFGSDKALNEEDALTFWQRAKALEKSKKAQKEN